uniref:glycosyl hydrolase family 95 catalytic domain-containing protein n=1 Tax=Lachnospira eligens TaxID=39485 RepID=UPI003FEE8301
EPRLCVLLFGLCNLLCLSAYTMFAIVNILVSGMNSSVLYEAGTGYMWFILRQIPDWVNNAAMVYGMKDAVLVPVNTDGHRAMMVEYDINYPFQYWNAGAGWMLIPIYEFLQTYGDAVITTFDASLIKMYGKDTFDVRKDVYEPLLKKAYNFWKQIGNPEYYTDTDGNARYEKGKCSLNAGEHYLIIPSFSPENKPLGYHSAITANAAMDISAAKDVINMYIEMINKEMAEENRTAAMQAVSEAEALLRLLPDFMYDESGAVKEWSMKEYGENNAHRHISHLYPAWPALQTQHDSKLAAACRQAVINRNHENKGKDDTASHGWIHKALVEARLKNADAVYDTLNLLVHSDIFYTTLFTDHNTDRSKGVYCTDTAFGLVGIINEMLVYSDEHTIELLPAWSDKLGSGMVKGLRTRCGITIDELKWDVDKKKVYVSLDWGNADEINIVCGKYEIEKIGHERQS